MVDSILNNKLTCFILFFLKDYLSPCHLKLS
jgi:hypothetical protein